MLKPLSRIWSILNKGQALPEALTQRDIKAFHLSEQLYYAVQQYNNEQDDVDPYEYVPYFYYDDLYFAPGNQIYITLEQKGKLFRGDVMIGEDGTVSLTNVVPARIDVTPVIRTAFVREAGERLILSISSTATLLRNSKPEIDSCDLFDSFVERFESGHKILRNVAHLPSSDVGEVVWLARDENLLLSATQFYDSALGTATFEAIRANPEYWGDSIEFLCLESEAEESGLVVNKDGILTRISSLPEKVAAAQNTQVVLGEYRMKDYQLEALKEIAKQNPKAVDDFIAQAGDTNREIAESGQVTRSEEQGNGDKDVQVDMLALAERVNALTERSNEQQNKIQQLESKMAEMENPHQEPARRSFSLVPFSDAVGPTGTDKQKTYAGSRIGRKLRGE